MAVMVVIAAMAMAAISSSVTVAAALSFNITGFNELCSDGEIEINGDASCLGPAGVQLTGFHYYAQGQARYSKQQLPLWENVTGAVANFTTDFVFAIDNDNGSWTCDGLAFFIASSNYSAPANQTAGGLGLVAANETENFIGSTEKAFVAVEFDTYNNEWDSWGNLSHVGIDVKSVRSAVSKRWGSYTDGREMSAQVSYQGKNLCVVFTGMSETMAEIPRDRLCYRIDLTEHLTERTVVGFSASTAWRYQSHTIKSWSFSSDLDPDRKFETPTTVDRENTTSSGGGAKRSSLAIGLISLATISSLVVVMAGGWTLCWKLRRRRPGPEESPASNLLDNPQQRQSINQGVKFVPFDEVRRATNDFLEVLGRGGFGVVYKGRFETTGQSIAVKKVFLERGGMDGFIAELVIITQLQHPNLVMLLGWSSDADQRLYYLIYEYMENGSLDRHLHGSGGSRGRNRQQLNWTKRYRIAKELARGIDHLHHGSRNSCVLHRDIKASNVLLDSNFNAKLGDFGFARVVNQDGNSHTYPGGTHGYIAPECATRYTTTTASDTYSFGVVALEIATGKKALLPGGDGSEEQRHPIGEWVWNFYGNGNVFDAAHARLNGEFDREEMRRLLLVGLHCAHPNRDHRLSIADALNLLTDMNVPLPLLHPFPHAHHSNAPPRLLSRISEEHSLSAGSYNAPPFQPPPPEERSSPSGVSNYASANSNWGVSNYASANSTWD